MAELDRDLRSIQEARDFASRAFAAWKKWSTASHEQADRVSAAMTATALTVSERLGILAYEETGYGVAEHKHMKNIIDSKNVWESITDIRTVGIVGHDPDRRTCDIAWPVGVIAALTPSTNPTSTVIFKILVAVKARDAIIIAPHPSAAKCSYEAARIVAQAAEQNG